MVLLCRNRILQLLLFFDIMFMLFPESHCQERAKLGRFDAYTTESGDVQAESCCQHSTKESTFQSKARAIASISLLVHVYIVRVTS